jgi:alpha-beta hydrolase superfamily lysophospholipase
MHSNIFNSQTGQLYYHQWQAEKPKAWIHIMHGMAEHSARYAELAAMLNQQGIMVTGDDHRGHGQTGEAADNLYHIGDRDSWNQLIEDQWQLISYLSKQQQLPLIILGHSMGSFMATRFCQVYGDQLQSALNGRLKGLVLSGSNYDAPIAFKIAAGAAWIERARLGPREASPIMEQLSFGAFDRSFKPTRTEKDWLSRDHQVVDDYIADPWCGGAISTQSWYDFLQGMAELTDPKAMAKIDNRLPIYLFSGDLDPVGKRGAGVIKLQQALVDGGVKSVEIKLYQDGRHEMLNEINKEEVYNDLLAWTTKALQAG